MKVLIIKVLISTLAIAIMSALTSLSPLMTGILLLVGALVEDVKTGIEKHFKE